MININSNKIAYIPPLKVKLMRGENIESIHTVHAVVCDKKGRILVKAGDAMYETFMRSSLKPFQAIPFISSGTKESFNLTSKSIAIACGSHSGTTKHSREVFKILWNSEVDVSHLQCPLPESRNSNLEHNCSGQHASFLATCKKMNWSLDNYLERNHPLQIEIERRISELLAVPSEELISEQDNCGAPTLKIHLAQMALLFAKLSNSDLPELEQISRSMIAHPEFVAGEGKFDTELMRQSHGLLVSKGGSEGIQCISRMGEDLGLAIKSIDGSKRAKQAVAIHLLRQLEWITPLALEEIENKIFKLSKCQYLQVEGELKFQVN